MENITINTNSTSSYQGENRQNTQSGFFGAGISKFIADAYKNFLQKEIFGGSIPKLPNLPKNPGDGSSDIQQEIYLLQEILFFYEEAKEGKFDSRVKDILNDKKILALFKGTSLGSSLEKLAKSLSTASSAKDVVKDMEDSDTGFFGSLSDWFQDSDTKNAIYAFLNDPSTSQSDLINFETAFVSMMANLMINSDFNMGQGLDKLFFGFINAQLGFCFPQMLYYNFYQQALAMGLSGQAAFDYAESHFKDFTKDLPPKDPISGASTPNYDAFLEDMQNFNFQLPSEGDIEIDIQLIEQAIGNFLGS